MKEFGSDFHYIETCRQEGRTVRDCFPSAQFYADGRQALIAIYKHQNWSRLWVPEYFCFDVLGSLIAGGVVIKYYNDYPGFDDAESIKDIPFADGDALLRVNYFGLRGHRTNTGLPVPVVEDHTHDLIGEWAANSDADWCIASLRKSLPIAEGGILWSPKGHVMPAEPECLYDNETVAERRWQAMALKAGYLSTASGTKEVFRKEMIDTEAFFDNASVSSIDERSRNYLDCFDISRWYSLKQRNWQELKDSLSGRFILLEPESHNCNPFSFTILCESADYREELRKRLIDSSIYPAILWDVPSGSSSRVKEVSSRMLSIHCDGRYSVDDIRQMGAMIENVL